MDIKVLKMHLHITCEQNNYNIPLQNKRASQCSYFTKINRPNGTTKLFKHDFVESNNFRRRFIKSLLL